MKILFIAPYVPSRIRVRPFQFIKELAARHEVHVLALGEVGGGDARGSEELARLVKDFQVVRHSKIRGIAQALAALPTAVPMCAAFCWSPAMTRAVEKSVSEAGFDVVHIEHLRAAHFASACGDLPVVFDAVDCLTGLFGQMQRAKRNPVGKLVMAEETWKLRRYEPRVLPRFDRVIVTSSSEREEFCSLDPTLRIDVLPNGVDTEYFAPQGMCKTPRRVVFSGKMSFDPNVQAALWFAENIFVALKDRYADAEFVIVGSDPPTEVKRLCTIPGVTVTGYVDDIRPYLDSSSIAVAPMQVAAGIQNKVLEAMAMGLPVVATPIATRAFGKNCPGIIQAADAQQMIDNVSALMDDPDLAARIGRCGREEVLQNFSWASSVHKLERIYQDAINERAARSGGRREHKP